MDAFAEHWKAIFDNHQASKRPVQICVGLNADAAAAARTLTSLLRTYCIAFEAHPVVDYNEIKNIANETIASQMPGIDPPDTLVLLGCGGQVDLAHHLDLSKFYLHVLDSARPMHLGNLRNGDLHIWCSNSIRMDVDRFFKEHNRKRRRREHRRNRRHRHGEDSDSDEFDSYSDSSDEEESEFDDDEVGAIDWLAPGEVPAELEEAYYSTRWGGASAAVSAMQLSEEVNQFQRSFIWHAAIGVTDLHLRHCILPSEYVALLNTLKDAVNQLNARSRANALDDISNAAGAAAGSTNFQQVRLVNTVEHRLMLLRHWNLWAALWHEPVIAAKFKLHHVDDGEERMRSLLARIGVSRAEAETPWAQITQEVRARTLHLLAEEFGPLMDDFSTPTITRAVGFGTEVSAFDACRFFSAHICVPPAATATGTVTKDAIATHRRGQFWLAYDSLETGPHNPKFGATVAAAVGLQKDVATATAALLGQRGAVLSTRVMHYALISAGGARATESFWDPQRLRCLANQLMYTLAAEKTKKSRQSAMFTAQFMKPVLLCGPHPDQQTFTVVGVHATPSPAAVVPVVGCFEAAIADQEGGGIGAAAHNLVDRAAVLVHGRDEATHLVESVHLRMVSSHTAKQYR